MKNTILKILKNDTRLLVGEEFNQTMLIDLVERYDKKIIESLFSDDNLRDKFFIEIKNTWVFKVRDFVFFMEENKINNSFTNYKNRIGLTDGNHFLKDTQDVALDFPFKDCVLEGGQSSDEGKDNYYKFDEKVGKKEEKLGHKPNQYNLKQSNRKEVFFNQVLAKDEIDRLKDPKALVNWKKYTQDGVSDEVKFNYDENGTIKDNLIIKGNNLLALHTLKSNFAGKVKLIYIDPPYNTDNDSFNYNDNFNHSTWLTFMKNRLEVAKDLLRDDGVIFVQCDDNEQAYLKVLMDEVFGRDNFVGTLIHQRAKGGGNAKFIVKGHDYICIYSKKLTAKQKFIREKVIQSKVIERDGKRYIRNDDVVRKVFGKYDKSSGNRRCFYEELTTYKNDKQIKKIEKDIENGVYVLEEYAQNKTVIVEYRLIEDTYSKLYSIVNALSEKGTNQMEDLGLSFDNPKPEEIIKFIINSVTNENDIVLDYHLGSGTTCAVAHKMGRQYIGIEQMDYIEDIAVKRMQKVIEGEQGGISKSVNWQGGGEFVYCELAKWNEQAKDKINACETLKDLINLFDELYETYFLNYNLKLKEFKEKVIKEDNFKNLDLNKQKEMFLTMLDLNQMYVQASEMADAKYGLSDDDQEMTNKFYKDK